MVAAAQPAAAQCRLCAAPATAPEQQAEAQPMRLEVETRLDFDQLVLTGPGEGSATLRPDGSRSVTGTVASLSGRAMVGSATIRGEPGRLLRIDLPSRIELFSLSGGRVTIDSVASDLPAVPRLDQSGALTFRFGGRLQISGDAEGEYSGDLSITAEYL